MLKDVFADAVAQEPHRAGKTCLACSASKTEVLQTIVQLFHGNSLSPGRSNPMYGKPRAHQTGSSHNG
eukprot:2621582-Alexandrium_andersonii.AAC.1